MGHEPGPGGWPAIAARKRELECKRIEERLEQAEAAIRSFMDDVDRFGWKDLIHSDDPWDTEQWDRWPAHLDAFKAYLEHHTTESRNGTD